ncbi:MAG TPA: sulfatase-like hydrolase/transferase, partial [Bryobacteraceae bacterium]|nr:sulfatase-like hydrolase/transferase [Bryobacteraceae bacterium]
MERWLTSIIHLRSVPGVDEKSSEKKRDRISRRRFIGAMGAAAAAAGALQSGRSQNAASQAYYFQDSFGNVVPVDPALIDFGLYPPPVPGGDDNDITPDTAATGFSTGYPAYNILLIVVDQMRNPAFWLPSGNNWLSTYAGILPNITGLARRYSFLFPNYFVAATACTPSRACLLTGLYSQQTCVFQTFGPAGTGSCLQGPPLLPFNPGWNSNGDPAGFPTIGNVLSQSFNGQNGYNCTWIGKWHLSCESGVPDGTPGQNGPSDYGFNSNYNIPTASNG